MINLKPNKLGFTLVEILVVLAVLMIIFGVTLVSFRAFSSQIKLNGSAKELIDNLRYAQQLSVTEQIDYGIVFSTTTEQKYEIVKHQNDSTSTVKKIELDQEINFKSISPLEKNEIRFNSYGAVRESGDIVLENEKNETIIIKVRPSGFIKKSD